MIELFFFDEYIYKGYLFLLNQNIKIIIFHYIK